MKSYKVTCLFQTDWQNIIPAMFGSVQPDSSQISNNVGLFNFSTPVVPNNLGPLVLIEESDTPYLFD